MERTVLFFVASNDLVIRILEKDFPEHLVVETGLPVQVMWVLCPVGEPRLHMLCSPKEKEN